MQALKRAIDDAGGVMQLATAAGLSPAAIYFWLDGSRRMSAESALRIERASGVPMDELLRESIAAHDVVSGM